MGSINKNKTYVMVFKVFIHVIPHLNYVLGKSEAGHAADNVLTGILASQCSKRNNCFFLKKNNFNVNCPCLDKVKRTDSLCIIFWYYSGLKSN